MGRRARRPAVARRWLSGRRRTVAGTRPGRSAGFEVFPAMLTDRPASPEPSRPSFSEIRLRCVWTVRGESPSRRAISLEVSPSPMSAITSFSRFVSGWCRRGGRSAGVGGGSRSGQIRSSCARKTPNPPSLPATACGASASQRGGWNPPAHGTIRKTATPPRPVADEPREPQPGFAEPVHVDHDEIGAELAAGRHPVLDADRLGHELEAAPQPQHAAEDVEEEPVAADERGGHRPPGLAIARSAPRRRHH